MSSKKYTQYVSFYTEHILLIHLVEHVQTLVSYKNENLVVLEYLGKLSSDTSWFTL